MKRVFTIVSLLALVAACSVTETRTEPFVPDSDRDEAFAQIEAFAISPTASDATTPAQVEAEWVAAIDGARETVNLAAARFFSEAIAEALIRAAERGVTVRLVGDEDAADDIGFVTALDAGLSVTFGNGPNVWNPQPGIDVRRPGSHNRMSHNMLLVDRTRVWMLTGGIFAADSENVQIGLRAIYEDLGRDFLNIFDQNFGGTFATTLTAFDAMTSADPNNRTFYPTPFEAFEFYFSPSEPLAKEVVDRVYAARSSVWIVSSELANDFLYDALVYKARAGFDVRVVVDENAEVPADDEVAENFYSRVSDLEARFEAIRSERGTEEFPVVLRRPNVRMTAVLLDHRPSDFVTETELAEQIMILTQPLQAAIPFVVEEAGFSSTAVSRPSDVFTDGTLVVIPSTSAGTDPNLTALSDFVQRYFEQP